MKVNFQALGCRLNEAELESWSNEFIQQGHELALNSDDADLVIFNSCSVTAEADRKSRKLINRIHKSNPQSTLVVTGCYASLQAERVKQQLGVDMVIPNQQKDSLVNTVIKHYQPAELPMGKFETHTLFDRGRHRAFIKIQDGCRYRCTFCIVTIARGDERSRLQQEIIEEINRHHQQGVQEVVITGVHVGGYGSDTGTNLYELLSEILDKTTVPRIRLASVEPWDLSENFFELFKDNRLMPHMHLPLQSGSDSVLRRMARRCKTAEFEAIVDKARSTIPLFNITTDLIVGFPGETEKEWNESVSFVERIGFGHMHIFRYSGRQGTKAESLPDQVDKAIKKDRSRQMHVLAARLKAKEMALHLGSNVEVLWEKVEANSNSSWMGYTPHYYRIRSDNENFISGDIGLTGIKSMSAEYGMFLG